MAAANGSTVGEFTQPRVEVVTVWPRDGYIRVACTLHDLDTTTADDHARTGPPHRAVLVMRGNRETVRTYTATPSRESLWFALPVADLVPPEQFNRIYWDLYFSLAVDNEDVLVRIGRHLDDIEDKKNIMAFPGQLVSGTSHDARVAPYYTDKNNLSIRVRQLQRSEATA